MPLIVGLGENSVDEVVRLPAMPQPGGATSKLPIAASRILPGGQVATTLATYAALGGRARYAGAFGSDAHGERVRSALDGFGVDIGQALIRNVPNRRAVILVDQSTGERVVLWERASELALTAADVRPEWLDEAALVHVDGVDVDAALELTALARARGLPVTSDIDEGTARAAELLDAVTIPILAERVPEKLAGVSDLASALRAVRRPHHEMLVVTLGSRGSVALHGDSLIHAPGFTVDALDTTGAGDVFRGALIHALLRQRIQGGRDDEAGDAGGFVARDDVAGLLRFANAAAAISCTREGALGGVPTLGEIERLLEEGSG